MGPEAKAQLELWVGTQVMLVMVADKHLLESQVCPISEKPHSKLQPLAMSLPLS